jgi:hypothetical protein
MDYNKVRDRYLRHYITDAQLLRFEALGIITAAQYADLYAEMHPETPEEGTDGQ